MAKQTINIGTTANDGTGDTLRNAGQKINSNFTEVYNTAQAAFDTANTGGGVDLGYFKIYGNTLGTKDDPDTGGWGGYTINIDPNGEGWSGIQIQSLAGQEAGGALTIFNNKEANSRINLNTQDGVQIYSNRGFLNLGSDMEAPGAPSHFHIAFDNSNSVIPGSDLFLGDDFNFLRIVNYAQGVFIGANNRTGGDQYEWRFDTDGALNLTGNGVVRKNGSVNIVASDYAQVQWVDSANVSLPDPNGTQGPTNWLYVDSQGINIETNIHQEGNSYFWNFGKNGEIVFPSSNGNSRTGPGNNLKFEKSIVQKIISTQSGTNGQQTVERLVISGGDSYYDNNTSSYLGEGGDIYLWAGRGQNGGDIKVDAGNSLSDQEGGTIKIRAGNSNEGQGGFVEIRSGTGATGAPVYVYSNNHQWIFNTDGSLNIPSGGDIKNSDGYSVVKSIPQNLQGTSANYTLVDSDAGKHIYKNDGDGYGVEVPTNASVAFPIGTAITIVSGDSWTYIYPADSETTLIWGAGYNKTSTAWYIPNYSMATLLKIEEDRWMLSGAGLAEDI